MMWIIIYSHNHIISQTNSSLSVKKYERQIERGIDSQTERLEDKTDRQTERGSIIRGSVSLSPDLRLISTISCMIYTQK